MDFGRRRDGPLEAEPAIELREIPAGGEGSRIEPHVLAREFSPDNQRLTRQRVGELDVRLCLGPARGKHRIREAQRVLDADEPGPLTGAGTHGCIQTRTRRTHQLWNRPTRVEDGPVEQNNRLPSRQLRYPEVERTSRGTTTPDASRIAILVMGIALPIIETRQRRCAGTIP